MLNLFLSFIVFFFIFGWKITEIFDIIFLISVMLILIAFLFMKQKLNRRTFFCLLIFLCLSSYSLAIVVLNGSMDLQIALRSIRSLFNFMGGAAVVYIYRYFYKEQYLEKIITTLYFSLVVHGMLILMMYFNEDLRIIIYSLANTYDYVNLNTPFLSGLRITGLTYGLAQTSVVQSFAIFLLPIVIRLNGFNMFTVISIPILIVSIFLTGRSGLFLLLIFLPLYLFLICFSFNRIRYNLKERPIVRISKVFYILPLFILSLFILINILPDQFFSYTLRHAEEVILLFKEFGRTSTTLALSKMYFLPEEALVFLFGSSNLGRGALGTIPSDVGYVRTIFAIGIVGTLLMVIVYVYGLRQSFLVRNYYDRFLGTTIFIILLASIFLNFKELALFTRNQWSVQSILLNVCFVILSKRQFEQRFIKR